MFKKGDIIEITNPSNSHFGEFGVIDYVNNNIPGKVDVTMDNGVFIINQDSFAIRKALPKYTCIRKLILLYV